MIPKIIHRIWIGPNAMPPQCVDYSNSWRKFNNDFQHVLWTNDNLPSLPEKCQVQFDKYGKKKLWAFQADVLRYYLIYEYGGIYVDTDFECFRNVSDLINQDLFVASPNNGAHWITNCVFGAAPRHPFLKGIIDTMKHETYHGPIFFSNSLKTYFGLPVGAATAITKFREALQERDIPCHEPKLFFSKRDNGIRYAYHHALASWHPKNRI